MEQSLAEMMAEFEAKGGAITAVPSGATGLDGMGLPPLTFTNVDAQRKKQAKEFRLKSQSHSREDDLALVAVIHQVKAAARSNIDLYRAMSSTNDRLQRLLRDYLKDDETVDRFRAMSREERSERDNASLVVAIREQLSKGVKGIHAIGRACGASGQRVSAVAKRYKITIPRGDQTIREPGRAQVSASQLQRWVDYLKEGRSSDVEREIRTTLQGIEDKE